MLWYNGKMVYMYDAMNEQTHQQLSESSSLLMIGLHRMPLVAIWLDMATAFVADTAFCFNIVQSKT